MTTLYLKARSEDEVVTAISEIATYAATQGYPCPVMGRWLDTQFLGVMFEDPDIAFEFKMRFSMVSKDYADRFQEKYPAWARAHQQKRAPIDQQYRERYRGLISLLEEQRDEAWNKNHELTDQKNEAAAKIRALTQQNLRQLRTLGWSVPFAFVGLLHSALAIGGLF